MFEVVRIVGDSGNRTDTFNLAHESDERLICKVLLFTSSGKNFSNGFNLSFPDPPKVSSSRRIEKPDNSPLYEEGTNLLEVSLGNRFS